MPSLSAHTPSRTAVNNGKRRRRGKVTKAANTKSPCKIVDRSRVPVRLQAERGRGRAVVPARATPRGPVQSATLSKCKLAIKKTDVRTRAARLQEDSNFRGRQPVRPVEPAERRSEIYCAPIQRCVFFRSKSRALLGWRGRASAVRITPSSSSDPRIRSERGLFGSGTAGQRAWLGPGPGARVLRGHGRLLQQDRRRTAAFADSCPCD